MDQDPSLRQARRHWRFARFLASPYTVPSLLLILVALFFVTTVLVVASAQRGTTRQFVQLQQQVADTNVLLVNIGRAQVCMTGTSLDDRRPATTNWCLVENGQSPLYPGVSPEPPSSG